MSLIATADVASQIPDFSGRWITASPGDTGREVRITQAKGVLKVTSTLDRGNETVSYNHHGTPRREAAGAGEERWTSAAWKNGQLFLTDTVITRTLETRIEHALSLDSAGRLILGTTRTRASANNDASVAPAPERKTVIVLQKADRRKRSQA